MSFLQQGLSVSETAALLSVTHDAVHDWLHRFKQGGLPAMKDQGGRGRKPLFQRRHMRHLKKRFFICRSRQATTWHRICRDMET
ncbi:helix-turn-helix domain-containing protein [Endozoicomonas numazuensis]|uniref:helix-turn-helix domain-containing protein n=1 Tax=Endozoicomonas numazuensis TaxID=1137799 RepID=UPI00137897CA